MVLVAVEGKLVQEVGVQVSMVVVVVEVKY
jgi:hypothetical protein